MDDVQQKVQRFREVLTKDWTDGVTRGTPLVTRISSAVITTRHFGMPSHDSPRLPADELLRIAADVTGVPLEVMTDAQGRDVQVWRPARGEVGWLPYDVPPANWTPPPPGYPE